MAPEDVALFELGRALRAVDYRFVAVSDDTRARINGRPENAVARSLRDVFGWNRPFRPNILPKPMLELVRRANVVTESGGLYAAGVRFATLGGALFVHSATSSDAPFGPETYRFCRLLDERAQAALRVVDVGCGAGAGGLGLMAIARRVVLADANAVARRYAHVNAALAGLAHHEGLEVVASDGLTNVDGPIDLVVANLQSASTPAAGGALDGDGDGAASINAERVARVVREALARLVPGGRLIVAASAPVVAGRDTLLEAVEPVLAVAQASFSYGELEADVAGSALDSDAFAAVERVAAVALIAIKSGA